MAWLPWWFKMTLPEVAMLVGIFVNLSVTVVIAFHSGQKVRQVDEHERRIEHTEERLDRQAQQISDHHGRIVGLESDVKALNTRTAR